MKIRSTRAAVLALAFCSLASAQPASRPASRPGAAGLANGLMARVLQPYRDVLKTLDLTPEQQTQTDDILRDAGQQIRDLAPELQGAAPQERRAKLQEIFQKTNQQIVEKLNDDQKQKFREGIQEAQRNMRPGGGLGGANGGANGGGSASRPASRPEGRASGGALGRLRGKNAQAEPAAPAPPTAKAKGASTLPKVGDPAPELTLKKVDGNPFKLSSSKGRVTVLIFGSYSAPTLREKADKLNEIAKTYRGRNVEFALVYTAEAFPTGDKEIERNKKEKIEIPQHKSISDRQAAAKTAQKALKLEMDIVLDDMEGTASKVYGLAPNGVAIIGKDGNIADMQHWMDPSGIKAELDEILKVTVP